jgi:hypothetical protein
MASSEAQLLYEASNNILGAGGANAAVAGIILVDRAVVVKVGNHGEPFQLPVYEHLPGKLPEDVLQDGIENELKVDCKVLRQVGGVLEQTDDQSSTLLTFECIPRVWNESPVGYTTVGIRTLVQAIQTPEALRAPLTKVLEGVESEDS